MRTRGTNKKLAPWMGAFIWAIWALSTLGSVACGGDDTSKSAACQTDEDCPWGACNEDTHQCESTDKVDAGGEGDADVSGEDAQAPECVSDTDCQDPAKSICDDGRCRGCSGDSECTARWPDRPHCSDGGCIGVCGNGSLDAGEECDTQEFGNKTCSSETGLSQGTLSCTADCHVDTSNCYQCGNGSKEGPEVCDGADLDGHGCSDFGFAFGDLACASDCMSFDESDCNNCGNGTCDDGETTGNCPEDCGWVDLAVGRTTTCAIKADGTLWCWGQNDRGQAGIGVFGTNADQPSPVQVHNLSGVTKVTVGGKHVCALTTGSHLYCWGDDSRWAIRTDYSIGKLEIEPYDMQQTSAAEGLVTGDGFTCWGLRDAFTQTMTVTCRGDNSRGEIGTGTTSGSPVGNPFEVPIRSTRMFGSMRRTQCSTRHYFSTQQHRLVDEIWCWGANDARQAVPTSTQDITSPTKVTGVEAVSGGCGDTTTCALDRNGTVHCWGGNDHYQRGVRSAPSTSANVVPLTDPVEDLTVGARHSCAWTADGRLFCWGSNNHNEAALGFNALVNVLPTEVPLPGNETVAKAGAGSSYTCVLTDSARIYCWGSNEYGQVGNGSKDIFGVRSPIEVDDPYGD